MTRFLVPIIGFAVLVAFFWVGLGRDPSLVPSPLVGKPMPEFSLPRLKEPEQVLGHEDLLGKFSVLNVWATWCVGCRQEHPVLNEIAARGEIPIYGLNWKDDSTLARRWLQELGDPYTATAVDLEGRVAIDWGVYGAPETFLLAPDGTVLYRHISPLTMEIWEREFVGRVNAANQP